MARGSKLKVKLYYLAKIMLEYTDETHALGMQEIIDKLNEYGVSADRKSIYNDMATLSEMGIEIEGEKYGRGYIYRVVKKHFELAELKLLVDAIQSSKFITEKKSDALIKKLMSFASIYEAGSLKRQVVVHGRVKTMNESIYYIIDDLHTAISEGKKIRFEYLRWTAEKKMEKRREKMYEVSPWALTWNNENYYLIAYDSDAKKLKHYRVDKMNLITITEEKNEGRECFEDFDMAAYATINFGMFGGEVTAVTLEFKNEIAGILLDRFGKDIPIIPTKKEGISQTSVKVAVSDQFFGWLYALGTSVKITAPESVKQKFKQGIEGVNGMYE